MMCQSFAIVGRLGEKLASDYIRQELAMAIKGEYNLKHDFVVLNAIAL
jgi:hypothetical protein